MLMGRRTYELFAKIYPSRADSWGVRVNAMQKYVFSSTLETADWENSTCDHYHRHGTQARDEHVDCQYYDRMFTRPGQVNIPYVAAQRIQVG